MFRKQCETMDRNRLVYVDLFKMIHCYLIDRQVGLSNQEEIFIKGIIPTQSNYYVNPQIKNNSVMKSFNLIYLYVCFVDRCLSFCTFSFGHCVVCSSSIYGFWLPLWYVQTLLDVEMCNIIILDNRYLTTISARL